MRENKNKFEDSAGDFLRNQEQQPPDGIWERIESGIHRRKRKIILLRYSSLAATLIILLSFGIYFINDTDYGSDKPVFTQKSIKPVRSDSTGNPSIKVNIVKSDEKNVIKKNIPDSQKKSPAVKVKYPHSVTRKASDYSNNESIASNDLSDKKSKSGINESAQLQDDTDNNQQSGLAKNGLLNHDEETGILNQDVIISEPKIDLAEIQIELPQYISDIKVPIEAADEKSIASNDGKWDLAVGYGVTSGIDLSQDEDALNQPSRYSYDDFSAQLANQTSFFEEIENTIHDAPIAIGLVAGKSLSNRLSIETGIIYTRLAFRIKTDDLNPFYRKYRNEMYYLGVPAGIRYSFVKQKKFSLYTVQWAVIEKGITGRWHIDTYSNGVITESESKKQLIRGVQFSSITALGGQYNLTGNVSLFGQGGVQIFYLNKTQPFNIRSRKDVWPAIQIGLRVDF